jgi:hypothetical protein
MADPAVPDEFSRHGIKTPEEAADWIADILGVISVDRMGDSAERAQADGRAGEQVFYERVRELLVQRYEELLNQSPDEMPDSDEDWDDMEEKD